MRHTRLRIVVLVLLTAVACAYPLVAPTPHRIDEAHCERIANGMTRAEVEAIFGVPPGRYDWAEESPAELWVISDGTASTLLIGEIYLDHPRDSRGLHTRMGWISRHGAFTVVFNHEGRVEWKHRNDSKIVPPWQRWWEKLRKK